MQRKRTVIGVVAAALVVSATLVLTRRMKSQFAVFSRAEEYDSTRVSSPLPYFRTFSYHPTVVSLSCVPV